MYVHSHSRPCFFGSTCRLRTYDVPQFSSVASWKFLVDLANSGRTSELHQIKWRSRSSLYLEIYYDSRPVSVNQSDAFSSPQPIPESFLNAQDPPTYIDPALTTTFPIAQVVPIPELRIFYQHWLTTLQHIQHNSSTDYAP